MYHLVLCNMLRCVSVKALPAKPEPSSHVLQKNSGFTLIELLAVVFMIGVLAAIAAPSWLTFTNRQRANAANEAVLRAIQEAQREARKNKRIYSVSIRTNNNIPEIAIHPGSTPTNWRTLGEDLGIKPGQVSLGTNVSGVNTIINTVSYGAAFNTSTPQTISFDYTGNLNLPVKRKNNNNDNNNGSLTAEQNKIGGKGLIIAVAVPQPGQPTRPTNTKRCVIVRTLLGAIETQKDSKCD